MRLGLVVVFAVCGLVLLPTVGLAGQTGAQSLHKLIEFTGKGTKTSTAFHIKSTPVQIGYSYSKCWQGSGTFLVGLDGHKYNHIYVSVSGTSGKKRVWAYPKPGTFHVTVNTTCRWYVAVWGK